MKEHISPHPHIHVTDRKFYGCLVMAVLMPLLTGDFSRGPHMYPIVIVYLEAMVVFATTDELEVGMLYMSL